MKISRIIATPTDNPHKWDLEVEVKRGFFDTNVVDVEWYFGARQATPLNTGKTLTVKDFTFKGDSKVVRVYVTDSKGGKYSAEITLVAVDHEVTVSGVKKGVEESKKKEEKPEPKKEVVNKKASLQQPAKPPTELPKANAQVDAKLTPEPKKPFFKPDSEDLEKKTTPNGKDENIVVPESPTTISPKK